MGAGDIFWQPNTRYLRKVGGLTNLISCLVISLARSKNLYQRILKENAPKSTSSIDGESMKAG